ncbi:TSUP family transporter, partial [Candidatus Latescibacterota bacterium]
MDVRIIALFLIGALFGYIGGYTGIGGAPFLVSFSVIVLGLSQHEAQGTILAVMLGPMSLFSVIVMWDRVKVLKWYILSCVLSYAVFSYFGAAGAYAISEVSLKLLFGFLLLSIGIINLYISKNLNENDQPLHPGKMTVSGGTIPANSYTITIFGIVTGLLGGFFGIGAGVLMMPVFIGLFGIHKDDARALSLAILLPPVSLGAVIKY